MTQDDRMETITDPAAIRATDEPDERTTPAPVGAAVALDLDAIEARANAATDGPWRHGNWSDHLGDRRVISGGDGCYEVERLDIMRAHDVEFIAHARGDVPALVAEVRRLTSHADGLSANLGGDLIAWAARAEAAEAEVVTLRARLAAVESLADEWADRKRSDGMSGNAWIGLTLSGVAADLRVALGDEPTIVGSPPAAMVADYLAGKHGPPHPEVDALMAEDAALATTGEGE